MHTVEGLQKKTLGELKEIGWQLNVLPEGDRRCRRNWIEALANAQAPQPIEPIENSPGVDRNEAQKPIAHIDIQAQEPIENSPGVDPDEVTEPIEFPDLSSALAEIAWLRAENRRLQDRVRSQTKTISEAKNISPVMKPNIARVRKLAEAAFLTVARDAHYGWNLIWGERKKHFRKLKEIWDILILDDWPLSDIFSPPTPPTVPDPLFPRIRSRFGAIPFCDDNLIDTYALGFAGVGSSGRSPPGGGDAML